jgi:hypothetical protein
MSEPLFVVTTAVAGRHGPIRAALDGRLAQLEGRDWEPDMVLLVQSLADRIDQANAMRDRRGYVTLSAEYRAARIDLFGADDGGGTDPLAEALAAFSAAETGHPAHPGVGD